MGACHRKELHLMLHSAPRATPRVHDQSQSFSYELIGLVTPNLLSLEINEMYLALLFVIVEVLW